MSRVVSAFVLATCLGICGWSAPVARAQPGGVAVAFRNDLNRPVIVQGYSIINGMQKTGMAVIVLPGKTLADINVPANSIRYYLIADANRPAILYLRNFPIAVGTPQDQNFAIRGIPPKVFLETVP